MVRRMPRALESSVSLVRHSHGAIVFDPVFRFQISILTASSFVAVWSACMMFCIVELGPRVDQVRVYFVLVCRFLCSLMGSGTSCPCRLLHVALLDSFYCVVFRGIYTPFSLSSLGHAYGSLAWLWYFCRCFVVRFRTFVRMSFHVYDLFFFGGT